MIERDQVAVQGRKFGSRSFTRDLAALDVHRPPDHELAVIQGTAGCGQGIRAWRGRNPHGADQLIRRDGQEIPDKKQGGDHGGLILPKQGTFPAIRGLSKESRLLPGAAETAPGPTVQGIPEIGLGRHIGSLLAPPASRT